mgnify:CR=1 FL=1
MTIFAPRKSQIYKYIIMVETKKRVYRFGGKTAEGEGTMRELLGGKGANLAEMSRLGMPVPAGFTITTECCAEYYALGGGYSDELKKEVAEALEATEKLMGKKFGDAKDPLLVSCRSGARSSRADFRGPTWPTRFRALPPTAFGCRSRT